MVKLKQALRARSKHGQPFVYSKRANAYQQDEESLVYWLLLDEETNLEEKKKQLETFLSVTDWKPEGTKTKKEIKNAKKK